MISGPPFHDDYPTLRKDISRVVQIALEEDIVDGDITAQLIPVGQQAEATIITRKDGVVCRITWMGETSQQMDHR